MNWKDKLKTFPRMSKEQIKAVKEIMDRHMSYLAFDYPGHDEVQWMVQRDLDLLLSAPVPQNHKADGAKLPSSD